MTIFALALPARTFYIESYGCQMNLSDSEIVASLLTGKNYRLVDDYRGADLILLNTCAIRDHAEQRVRNRLGVFGAIKRQRPGLIVAMLGCMAERLKHRLLEEEKLVDIVAGPDAYRDLPRLIGEVNEGRRAVNVLLSREETYADINPVRLSGNGVTAFISIMRGCDNMCSFCVVPFTRGRERSRDPHSILQEAKDLYEKGYREITLLGQNVDSYHWRAENPGVTTTFPQLLEKVAQVHPDLRIRFSTSHPKDMSEEALHVMARCGNLCRHIHLPVQSGSTSILEKMNRGYSREWYQERIRSIRRIIPGAGISTDIISGFCGETESDHRETLSLMEWVRYDFAYMFKYSQRPGTLAARKYPDDVNEREKTRRLREIIALQQRHSLERNRKQTGKWHQVLIEGNAKRSDGHWFGRNTQNIAVVFPKAVNPRTGKHCSPGEYVDVLAERCTSATLVGRM